MKLDTVASSGNDEFYTPVYAIEPIVPYLKKMGYSRVWCPFDTEDSNYVKCLSLHGLSVIRSHISDGQDFFTSSTPECCDCIVSNPPYSIKTQIIENLFRRNVPFAMLLGVVGLFESEKRFNLFSNNDFEVMYFNKRVSYFRDFQTQSPDVNPPFSSIYLCHKVLPSQIVFERISKK